MINKKRGPGVVKKPLGIRDMYKFFLTYSKRKISYKEYSNIIKEANKEIVDCIVKEAKILSMPYKLGVLQVSKYTRGFNKPTNKWSMDFKKSEELGFRVYHDSEFIYKFNWKKTRAKFMNRTGYKFKANRTASRMIPYMLKNTKVSYFK